MKRTLSILLAVVMLVAMIPLSSLTAFATSNTIISVENVSAILDSTVDVSVSISGNPGIASMGFTLTFDEDLTLVGASNGEAFSEMTLTPPAQLKKVGYVNDSCRFAWLGNENVTENGTILNLKFKVAADAQLNKDCVISITCDHGDVLDDTRTPVDVEISNGKVTIIDYTPGDVDGDTNITMIDVLTLCQFYVDGCKYDPNGYGINIKAECGDVDANGKVNMIDVLMICQYYVDGCKYDPEGYAVKLLPGKAPCEHILEKTEELAPTCTEDGNIAYWHCTKCGEYYRDANASNVISLESTVVKAKHSLEHFEEKAATTDEDGYKEHWKCLVCNKYFTNSLGTNEINEENVIVPKISRAESTVVYDVYGSDSYLESVGVINTNKSSFYADEGLVLNDLIAPEGYVFKGWSTASGTPVTEIEPGNARQITLNAIWDKTQYTVSFYSPIAPRSSVKRTIDESYPVNDLNELTKYKFMGWTDIYGNEVKIVKPGTKDITLYANWISYRNQTISNDYMNKGPIRIEDEENGQYLFVYDIGKIINVPLYTIKDFGNTTSGIIRVESESVSNSISSTRAKEITEMIAKSTTNSATWTLAKNWNELITNTEDFSETSLKESSVLISDGWSHTDGSEDNTGTVSDTGTLQKDNTNTKDLTTHNAGGSVEVDVEIAKKGLASKLSPVGVDIKAEGHYDYTHQGGTETDNGTDTYNLTHTNDLHSSSSSTTSSHNKTTSEKLAEEVSKKWGYSISKSSGGESSASENSSNTQSNENTYSTTFSYTTAEQITTVKEFSTASAEPGWHRLVCAGTVHVFAVVGYDIATHSYFFYSYSVLDDATSEFYDYSATNGEFNDYEVGVLPFECPISVHNEVSDKIYLTNGLIIDDKTGMVVDYDGNYTHVNIPDYYSRNNNDGTYDIVKIVGINPSVFAGNTSMKSVRLSNYITSIPNGAFSGCSSLETVEYNKINSIGNNAFANCVALDDFHVEDSVSVLGENAFLNVPRLTVNATNRNVAQNAVSSGAKKLTLNLILNPNDLKDTVLTIDNSTEIFTVNGFKKAYENIEIVSDAAETNINGITFINNNGVPINVSSSKVSFDNVNIESAKNLVMLLKAENTSIIVNGTNTFNTSNANAVLSKKLTVNKLTGSSVKCVLQITEGKVYICGDELTETDRKYFEVSDDRIEYINQEKYNNMINSHYVIFDPNGGEIVSDRKLVLWGSQLGELVDPTRDYHNFLGWFTEKEGGSKVTESDLFTSTEDIVLYAHWELKPLSGWVLASDAPSDASIENSKWDYTLRHYDEGSATEKSGWITYDSKRTSWGAEQTSYSNPTNGVRNVWTTSENYVSSYTHHYVYYHRTNGSLFGHDGTCSWTRHQIDLTYTLKYCKEVYGKSSYTGVAHDGDNYALWFLDYEYDSPNYSSRTVYHYQEPVYTYYYYKDTAEMLDSDPTGQTNVSNVVKYVQYRAK